MADLLIHARTLRYNYPGDIVADKAAAALEQAHAELADLRHDIARHVEIASAEATRAEAAERRADAWEAKFNDQCAKHDETTRRAMVAERRADEATRVLEEIAEWYDRDGSVGGCDLVMEVARAFLDAAKKEG